MANEVEYQGYGRQYMRYDPISQWNNSQYFQNPVGNLDCWICGQNLRNGDRPNVHYCQPIGLAQERCFMCGETMQNSGRSGVHLCSGGSSQPAYDPLLDFEFLRMRRMTQVTFQVERLETDETEKEITRILDSLKQDAEARGQKDSTELLKIRGEAFNRKYRQLRLQRREQLTRFLHLTDIYKNLRKKESELVALREKHEQDVRAERVTLAQREAQLVRREWLVNKHDTAVKEQREKADQTLTLNVGGELFQTSTHTLLQCKDSMLAAMFSGRHEVAKDKNGNPVLDRDPRLFSYILNYLRNNLYVRHWQLPRERELLEGLKMEADYFLLPGLTKECQNALDRLCRRRECTGKWRTR